MKLEFGEFKALFDIVYNSKLAEEKILKLFNILDVERKEYIVFISYFNDLESG